MSLQCQLFCVLPDTALPAFTPMARSSHLQKHLIKEGGCPRCPCLPLPRTAAGVGQSTYHHEAGFLFGGEHAHPQVLFPVAELHHVKGYSFRDCKHNGHCPDQHHLHCLPHGDSYPLDPTPGRHCSVPAQRVGMQQEQIRVKKATIGNGPRRCRLELSPKALSLTPSSSTPKLPLQWNGKDQKQGLNG